MWYLMNSDQITTISLTFITAIFSKINRQQERNLGL